VANVRRIEDTERWLRDQTSEAGDVGLECDARGRLMAAGVAWFAAQTKMLTPDRRKHEREKFAEFFELVLAGSPSVEECGRIAGFTVRRSRDLVRQFVEDVFVELAGRKLLTPDDLELAADLVSAHIEEVRRGRDDRGPDVGEAEDDGGGGG
jgi:hypothetical protein